MELIQILLFACLLLTPLVPLWRAIQTKKDTEHTRLMRKAKNRILFVVLACCGFAYEQFQHRIQIPAQKRQVVQAVREEDIDDRLHEITPVPEKEGCYKIWFYKGLVFNAVQDDPYTGLQLKDLKNNDDVVGTLVLIPKPGGEKGECILVIKSLRHKNP